MCPWTSRRAFKNGMILKMTPDSNQFAAQYFHELTTSTITVQGEHTMASLERIREALEAKHCYKTKGLG